MKWTRYIGWTDNTKRKQTKTNEKALEDGLAGTLRYSRPDWSNSHLIALVVPPAAFRNVCCCFLSLSLQFKFINFTYQTTTVKSSIKNFLELFDGLYIVPGDRTFPLGTYLMPKSTLQTRTTLIFAANNDHNWNYVQFSAMLGGGLIDLSHARISARAFHFPTEAHARL